MAISLIHWDWGFDTYLLYTGFPHTKFKSKRNHFPGEMQNMLNYTYLQKASYKVHAPWDYY